MLQVFVGGVAEVATSGLLLLGLVVVDFESSRVGESASDGVCGCALECLIALLGAAVHAHSPCL